MRIYVFSPTVAFICENLRWSVHPRQTAGLLHFIVPLDLGIKNYSPSPLDPFSYEMPFLSVGRAPVYALFSYDRDIVLWFIFVASTLVHVNWLSILCCYRNWTKYGRTDQKSFFAVFVTNAFQRNFVRSKPRRNIFSLGFHWAATEIRFLPTALVRFMANIF